MQRRWSFSLFRTSLSAAIVVAARGCAAASAVPQTQSQLVPKTYRAIAWYRREPFEMEQVVSYLQKRNGQSLKLEMVFSSSSAALHSGVPVPASSGAVKGVELICFSLQTPPKPAAAASPVAAAEDPEHPTTFVVFADGSLVGWNAQWQEMMLIRETLKAAGSCSSPAQAGDEANSSQPLHPSGLSSSAAASSSFVVDSMRYELFDRLNIQETAADENDDTAITSTESRRSFIQDGEDRIVLASPAAKYKIPFSYALAQSVKVDAYRREVDPISQQVKRWQQHLAKTGKLLCTLPSLRMVKSKLLSLVELLNFAQYVQTTPKIFWSGEYQLLRSVYRDACVHLEIEDRGAALKQMLEAVDESLSYLHDEVHANTNEFLTLVIIVLIAMELSVATGLVHYVVRCLRDALRTDSSVRVEGSPNS
jgi:uncharacterized Rmd1/YagE family protein